MMAKGLEFQMPKIIVMLKGYCRNTKIMKNPLNIKFTDMNYDDKNYIQEKKEVVKTFTLFCFDIGKTENLRKSKENMGIFFLVQPFSFLLFERSLNLLKKQKQKKGGND